MLMLDASASMAFPLATQGKWSRRAGSRSGSRPSRTARAIRWAWRFAGETGVAALPPRTRRSVIAEAARLLERSSRRGALARAGARARAPTQRVVLITDFLGDDDALLRAARERITAGADVLAIHIVAREELDPPRASIIAQ